jgi:exodeoxyribonuclease VII large subunit
MQPLASISLKDLLSAVKQTIAQTLYEGYWVRAEISEIRANANGHCYLELIEKDSSGKLIVAKTKATIWADTYRLLQPYFEAETGQSLKAGLNILVEVTVGFHEVYGFSCTIRDINPTFTLGDLAQKRQETIRKLKEDGIWEMNKSLPLPEPINRIAIISSASAAGYEDFLNQLKSNKKGYQFYCRLFPAIMQGDEASASIIHALDAIYNAVDLFDAVVIVRGGGATTDMLAFDEYELAAHCAQFPLPIITGIGHERDEAIVDMVAHTRCKTPTAVAAFLLEKMAEAETDLLFLQQEIIDHASQYLAGKRYSLNQLAGSFKQRSASIIQEQRQTVKEMRQKLETLLRIRSSEERHKIELKEKTLYFISPENILKKGYSLTIKNGRIVKSINQIALGDQITTILPDGKMESIVNLKE